MIVASYQIISFASYCLHSGENWNRRQFRVQGKKKHGENLYWSHPLLLNAQARIHIIKFMHCLLSPWQEAIYVLQLSMGICSSRWPPSPW